ncbi:preprotein translocase subunit SecG [Candidatus Gracilibacteria bacterium]|nr:preprotein translocase subunit SecG [Candidatus Gracilibacteria bacterium]
MVEYLKIFEVVIALLLIFVVLIQNKSVSLNLTSMSGGMNQVKKRGPEKVLHNATIVLGVVFVLVAIALFVM